MSTGAVTSLATPRSSDNASASDASTTYATIQPTANQTWSFSYSRSSNLSMFSLPSFHLQRACIGGQKHVGNLRLVILQGVVG